jgi:Tol biopolymer transport system component
MRKFSVLAALAVCLSLILIACGGTAPTNSPAPVSPTGTPAPTSAPATPTPFSDATATPVVLATVPVRPTNTLAPPTVTQITSPTARTTAANTPAPVPTQPAFVNTNGYQGKLSIIGLDFALYIDKLDGATPQAVVGTPGQNMQRGDVQLAQFPTWSPKGDKLAVISSNLKAGNLESGDVIIVNAATGTISKIIDKENLNGIYISWSPDGNFLTALMDNGNGLELLLFDTTKTPPARRKLLEGSAVYSAWANDSDTLYIHTRGNSGEVLARAKAKSPTAPLVSLGYSTGTTPTAGSLRLGGFRAPAFASDGTKLAYSVAGLSNNDREDIIIADVNGTEQGRVETAGVGAAFNWSPVNGQPLLAHSVKTQYQDVYDGIYLSDMSKPANNGKFESIKIISDEVIAFFWSPDGKKLAYVSVNDAGDTLFWNVYNFGDGKITRLVEWITSREQLQTLTYFDQYAQSDSVWSPDSRAIVFSGYDITARAGIGAAGGAQPDVFIVPAEGAGIGKKFSVGKGRLAFWAK